MALDKVIGKPFAALFSAGLICGLCAFSHAQTAVIDRILATVNGEIITLSEFEHYKQIAFLGAEQKPAGAEVDRKLLDQMIEKKVIEQEAERLKIEISDREVTRALEDILARNQITMQQLEANLGANHTSLGEYRELLKKEILSSEVVGRQVQAKITITEEDMEAYYNANMRSGEKPGARVRIQQILLLVPKESLPNQVQEVERRAAEIRQNIADGEDFARMAVTYSQGPAAKTGGDLGYFRKGELLPEIEKAGFSLEAGGLSPVIRTAVGFHIIKVLDRDLNESERSWKDHEREIKTALYNQEFAKGYDEWLKGLKEKSYIEVNF